MKILLTGASRGIGLAIRECLEEEHTILTPTRDELDLSNPQSIHEYCRELSDVDGLINNAGINIIKPFEEISSSDINQINQINYNAPLQLMQLLVPKMAERQFGRVVNISSIWGVRSKAMRALYSGTKFGLIGATKGLAREFGGRNVMINCVCPGFTNTALTAKSLSSDELNAIVKDIPCNRLAEPSEIARSVEFLISPENAYITGQSIVIDGGFTS